MTAADFFTVDVISMAGLVQYHVFFLIDVATPGRIVAPHPVDQSAKDLRRPVAGRVGDVTASARPSGQKRRSHRRRTPTDRRPAELRAARQRGALRGRHEEEIEEVDDPAAGTVHRARTGGRAGQLGGRPGTGRATRWTRCARWRSGSPGWSYPVEHETRIGL